MSAANTRAASAWVGSSSPEQGQRPSPVPSPSVLDAGGAAHDDRVVIGATAGVASEVPYVERGAPNAAPVLLAGERTVASASEPLPTLDDAMRMHIGRALNLTRGRIEGRGGAADLLAVNPHTLRGKMRRLKIDWSAYRS